MSDGLGGQGGRGGRGGRVAAIDLGATSGRVIVGRVGPGILETETVARFPNDPVRTIDGLHWNILGLYGAASAGLAEAFRRYDDIGSIGIDSWAVDYGLLRRGQLLGVPFHYRDDRNEAGVRAVHRRMPHTDLYARNGLQFLPFNTIYQLAAEAAGPLLEVSDTMLLVPDLLAYWLTGEARFERTNASTTGLIDVRTGEVSPELVALTGADAGILPTLISPGESFGTLLGDVRGGLGAPAHVQVTAVGSHDTASAVFAVPMDPARAAYISCGTWGLVGLELNDPVTTEAAREANFTNEGGVGGTVRFLHNVMGLWLLSESIRHWEREGERIDLPTLLQAAGELRDEVAVFDADDPAFLAPGEMPDRIAEHCRAHGLPVPRTRVEFARSIIESLADTFARSVRTAAQLADRTVEVVHIVGGGSLNTLLCQRTADHLGLPVLAGPVEATAIGNLLVQARAQHLIEGNAAELRDLVATVHPPTRYEPRG
ncbi:rhamnulokinase [Microbacterium sp. DT81.1]|uniref:rhamnulokinase n=1 Tax=Microbacterium sp. DT81.1 TaxID=3393413 RepID=UPI003CF93C87